MERTVLVINSNRSHLSEILSYWYDQLWRTVTADSLEEAIDILEDMQVDMIIAMEDFGWLSGLEFLRLTHNRYPRTFRILITRENVEKEKAVSSMFHAEDEIHCITSHPCNSEKMTEIVYEMFDLESDQLSGTTAGRCFTVA